MNLLHVVVLLAWATLISSWTTPVGVNLAWPPPVNSGYVTIDSQIVNSSANTVFPCASQPLTGNEPRTIFPITGGQLQFNVTNFTEQDPHWYFVVDVYLGQVSADTSQSHNEWAYSTTDMWKNITTGLECDGETFNATTLVNKALSSNFGDDNVVGMNATVGLRSVLFGGSSPPYSTNIEEVYQCAYVTFVSDNTPKADFGGACISLSTSPTTKPTPVPTVSRVSTASTTSTTTAASRTTSRPTPSTVTSNTATPVSSFIPTSLPPPVVGTTSSQSNNAITIGIAVGVSVGLSSILLFLGYLLFRHRRKHGRTIALDFWTHGREDENEEGVAGKLDKKEDAGKGADDSGESVRSAPPPVYGDVKDGVSRDEV